MQERVLVVDEDLEPRRRLVAVLVSEGFACATAETLAQARSRLKRFAPELVVLNAELAFAHQLRARADGPAVVVTGSADSPDLAARALELGALGYLTRPYDRADVRLAADVALRWRAATRHASADASAETVRRLARAFELRDPAAVGHSERVSGFCALMAARLGLDPELIGIASRLHDVGMLALPDSVRFKRDALTAAERARLQTHAQTGHELLAGSGTDLLDQAATIAWTHHERYDGTGYPRGLAGDEIPLVGRIAALADAFDALTTPRAGRPSLSLEEAFTVLREERGRQFDPAVVDAFLHDPEAVEAVCSRSAAPESEPAELLSMHEAAAAIGIAPGRLRRWADAGRIGVVRTAGGHRRFPVAEVRRFVGQQERRPVVHPLAPPVAALPVLADTLQERGLDLTRVAADALYGRSTSGWFGSHESERDRTEWVAALARSSRTGSYAESVEATELFLRRSYLQATRLLERVRFVEHVGRAAERHLTQRRASREDIAGARRLFTALGQAHLDRQDDRERTSGAPEPRAIARGVRPSA